MSKRNNNYRKKRGFSLLELSIVVVVVSVFIAAIASSSSIMNKAGELFSSAITTNSTVTSIEKLELWYESTTRESFDENEYEIGGGINSWYDKSPSVIKINASAVENVTPPTLVKGADQKTLMQFARQGYFVIDGSFFDNTDYAVFVVAATQNSASCDSTLNINNCPNNFFIGEYSTATSDNNKKIALGFNNSGAIVFSRGGEKKNTSNNKSYFDDNGRVNEFYKPSISPLKIFSFIHSQHRGNKIYENGLLVSQDEDTSSLHSIGNIGIGKNFNGRLGEIIIYSKELSKHQRHKIENYLATKWNITTTHGECLIGEIVDSKCIAGCSVNLTGIVETSVNAGSGVLDCDTSSGFNSGTISYDCEDGNLTPTGSCSCNSSLGYSLIGSTCSQNCTPASVEALTDGIVGVEIDDGQSLTINCEGGYSGSVEISCSASNPSINSGQCNQSCSVSIPGATDNSDVSHGSGTLDCDAGGNFSISTINYNCNDGVLTNDACSCITGYIGSNCDQCDNANNFYDDGGNCLAQCSVSSIESLSAGFTANAINSGDSNIFNCDLGYSGSVNISCLDGTPTLDSGACYQDCTFSGVTGIVDGTTVSHTSSTQSISCSGDYDGTINYTCNDGANPVIVSGSCTVSKLICSGGSVVSGRRIHTFTSAGTTNLSCTGTSNDVRVLVVGGGGGGGNGSGVGIVAGGGGGGQVLYSSSQTFSEPGTIQITVGSHGGGNSNGGTSKISINSVDVYVAKGGGKGSSGSGAPTNSGAPAGGGAARTNGFSESGGSGTQNGGNAYRSGSTVRAGGGGSSANNGGNATSSRGGHGGNGLTYDISGSNVTYGGGGGGGASTGGNGGSGGGGKGASGSTSATAGTHNLGGGGGGGSGSSNNGARGGSGIVIISYPN